MGPLSPGQAPGWFLRSEKRLRRPGAARSREISTTAEPRYVSTHVQHFQAVLGRVSDMSSIAKGCPYCRGARTQVGSRVSGPPSNTTSPVCTSTIRGPSKQNEASAKPRRSAPK